MRSRLRLSHDLGCAYIGCLKSDGSVAGRRNELPLNIRSVTQLEGELYEIAFAPSSGRSIGPSSRALTERDDSGGCLLIATVRIPHNYPKSGLEVIEWLGEEGEGGPKMQRRSEDQERRQQRIVEQSNVPEFLLEKYAGIDIDNQIAPHLKVDAEAASYTDATRREVMNRKSHIVRPSFDMRALMEAAAESTYDRIEKHIQTSSSNKNDPSNYPWSLTIRYGSPRCMLRWAQNATDHKDKGSVLSLKPLPVEIRRKRGVRTLFPAVYP